MTRRNLIAGLVVILLVVIALIWTTGQSNIGTDATTGVTPATNTSTDATDTVSPAPEESATAVPPTP